jgi:hypothetical protein
MGDFVCLSVCMFDCVCYCVSFCVLLRGSVCYWKSPNLCWRQADIRCPTSLQDWPDWYTESMGLDSRKTPIDWSLQALPIFPPLYYILFPSFCWSARYVILDNLYGHSSTQPNKSQLNSINDNEYCLHALPLDVAGRRIWPRQANNWRRSRRKWNSLNRCLTIYQRKSRSSTSYWNTINSARRTKLYTNFIFLDYSCVNTED